MGEWGVCHVHTNLTHLEVIMPLRKRNFKLRVIQAWLELLWLEEGVVRWLYWDTSQDHLTNLFERYRLNGCMGVFPPFLKSKYTCKTFLKSAKRYLSQADLDRTILEWINNPRDGDDAPIVGLRQRVEALLQTGQDEGVKRVVAEKKQEPIVHG